MRSTDGPLDYRLDVAAAQIRIRDRLLTLDTYNGGLPGPILRIRPSDRMRLLLRNLMRPMGIPLNKPPPLCAAHPGDTAGTSGHPHGTLDCVPSLAGNMLHGHTLPQVMIAINLHTHGLQVSPEGAADNVFVRIDRWATTSTPTTSRPTSRPGCTGTTRTSTAPPATTAGPGCPARSSSRATSTRYPNRRDARACFGRQRTVGR